MSSKAPLPVAALSITALTASPCKKPRPQPTDARPARSPEKTLTEDEVLRAAGATSWESVQAVRLASRNFVSVGPLASLVNLRALNLSCNRLACLLPLAALPALRQLNLQGNCIAGIPAGADPLGFACLEELDISFNSLQPPALAFLERLPKLRVLDISGNALEALSTSGSLTGFRVLRSLVATSNRLQGDVLGEDMLGALPLLQHLNLSRNSVTALSAGSLQPTSFPQLQVLDLSFNHITSNAAVQQLCSLGSRPRVELQGNPIAGATRIGHQKVTACGSQGAAGSSRRPLHGHAPMHCVEEFCPADVRRLARELHQAREQAAAAAAGQGHAASSSMCGLPSEGGSSAPGGGPAEGSVGGASGGEPMAEGSGALGHVPPELMASIAGSSGRQSAVVEEEFGACQGQGSSSGLEARGSASALERDEGSEGAECYGGNSTERPSVPLEWGDSELGSEFSIGTEQEGWGVSDPTVSLALQLGLDPLRLSWFAGGSSSDKENSSSNPTAAVNALKFALAHPPTAPPEVPVGAANHLKSTTSSEAKRRYKYMADAATKAALAGDEPASLEGKVDRMHAIDDLLGALRKRLAKVEANIKKEIAAAFELCSEEGPAAACNTLASPTPLPGVSSTTDTALPSSSSSSRIYSAV